MGPSIMSLSALVELAGGEDGQDQAILRQRCFGFALNPVVIRLAKSIAHSYIYIMYYI